MAARHSNTADGIPSAGYIRRSSSHQEKSLGDQKSAIQRYAEENGYSILRWYEDDAISGDDTARRAGFLKMHADACSQRDFDCILVWDQDRFGRFDSLEAGHWIYPLRNAGVRLVTIAEGPIDWNDFTGRMMFSFKQEAKHGFLLDLSRNTTRGHITSAISGFLCGQAAPYGYDRMTVDPVGVHQQRVRNGEGFVKSRAWKVTLVPSDDPVKVETIRWLFHTYAEQDVGLRQLSNALNKRGVPGPATGQVRRGVTVSGKWYAGSVRHILTNEAYVGTFTYAKRKMGKYNSVEKGEVKGRDKEDYQKSKVRMNLDEDVIRKPGAFEPLIEPKTFDRVQEKLTARKTSRTPNKAKHPDRYLLSGLVVCGCCGGLMHGTASSKTKSGKRYEWPKYICSTYNKYGNRDRTPDQSGCYFTAVDQGALMTLVLRKLKEVAFSDGNREVLERKIRERLEARQKAKPANADKLRKRLSELSRDIDRAAERLLTAPDDLMDLLAPKITAMREERDRLQRELKATAQQSSPAM